MIFLSDVHDAFVVSANDLQDYTYFLKSVVINFIFSEDGKSRVFFSRCSNEELIGLSAQEIVS